jgi:16S rRNA (cytidine1402-2'-O)-methyltransferase
MISVSETDKVGLYLVATPIGNLGDISPRAAQTLSEADFIAAEDTRRTLQLLNHLGLKKPLVSYFEHNRRERGQIILERILEGETCALVSDAGMPAISDPGEDLVRLCQEAGVRVSVVPGPCAAVSALAVSGLPAGRFCFEGFLSTAAKSRKEHLDKIKDEERTMIFYEAPHKLCATLKDIKAVLGERDIAVVRELTKLHEEVFKGTISQAIDKWTQTTPKGEIVLIIQGAPGEEKKQTAVLPDTGMLKAEMDRLREGGAAKAEALQTLAKKYGVSRKKLYDILKS